MGVYIHSEKLYVNREEHTICCMFVRDTTTNSPNFRSNLCCERRMGQAEVTNEFDERSLADDE
jgi:hypothetical protein